MRQLKILILLSAIVLLLALATLGVKPMSLR